VNFLDFENCQSRSSASYSFEHSNCCSFAGRNRKIGFRSSKSASHLVDNFVHSGLNFAELPDSVG